MRDIKGCLRKKEISRIQDLEKKIISKKGQARLQGIRVVRAGHKQKVANIIHIGAGVGTKAAKAGVLILAVSVIGCSLFETNDTPVYKEDKPQPILQSDDAAAADVSVSVADANQCVVDANGLNMPLPKAAADCNIVEVKPVLPEESRESPYLAAVRTFGDLVLEHGIDKVGDVNTPLFYDGLNVNDLTPVEWIAPNGERWVLSNLASQQNLFRTLDGLTRITGDPKYKQAAMDAIKYAFENLRSPNGLLYWGGGAAYDAQADGVYGSRHVFKLHYPYYELMWEVDPEATKEFIESFWSAHILDWSNLDMDRIGRLDRPLRVPKGWKHEYKGGPVFFKSKLPWGFSPATTGSDLVRAAAILSKLSGEKHSLIWAKRLVHRYVETRNPKTGIAAYVYNRDNLDSAQYQFGDDFRGHLVSDGMLFPYHPTMGDPFVRQFMLRLGISYDIANWWMSYFLLGEILGAEGKEFTQWALEELTASGKVAYRKKDNSWIPMLTDGTKLEGYICKKDGYYGPKGTVFKPIPALAMDFWAYSLAYRITADPFMWEMARNIAEGNGFGDLGQDAKGEPQLQQRTDCSDPYALLAFLELHRKTQNQAFPKMARRIGDNILANRFHKGFFLPSNKHIYAKFDAIAPLALLRLHTTLNAKPTLVPQVWPSRPFFGPKYGGRGARYDIYLIYPLTESPELPKSLHDAAVDGDIDEVILLISKGGDINDRQRDMKTPLHRAAINGHKQVVELLLAKGADVNPGDTFPHTPLHYAAEKGHKEIAELLLANGADVNAMNAFGLTPLHFSARYGYEDIVELLIANGADINAKNNDGQTPVDVAVSRSRNEVVELLIEKGADVSLRVAVRFGALAKVKSLIEKVADINAKDESGQTALHYAAEYGHKDVAELLIANGADVNVKNKDGNTPGHVALRQNHGAVIDLLITKGANLDFIHLSAYQGNLDRIRNFIEKGADANAMDFYGATPLHYAAVRGNKEVVEFLISRGVQANTGDKDGITPQHCAAGGGHKDIVQILIANGADVNVKDIWGDTPLNYAARDGYVAVVRLLIANGADVNVADRWGNTALSRAKKRGHTETVELLLKHGAKKDKAPESAPKEERPSDPNDVELDESYEGDIFGKAGSSRIDLKCL